ncbi:MAG: hypothetical protein ACRD2L_03895, partial [Terriglobia bacterium]
MSASPIPDELRSEHLFLLVGTNPLPNWVAAQLLVRPQGRLYLVCSKTTLPVAERLAKFALSRGLQQPEYVKVDSAFKAEAICRAIKAKLSNIKTGAIGFNYTGGTKAM